MDGFFFCSLQSLQEVWMTVLTRTFRCERCSSVVLLRVEVYYKTSIGTPFKQLSVFVNGEKLTSYNVLLLEMKRNEDGRPQRKKNMKGINLEAIERRRRFALESELLMSSYQE